MKNFGLIVVLCLFSGAAWAYDSNLVDVGWGLKSGTTQGSSPFLYSTVCGSGQGCFFFQVPYGGNYSFSLDLDGSEPYQSIVILGLNYTDGFPEVWTSYAQFSPYPRATHNFTAYSNVGIFQIYGAYESGTVTFYPETSYMTLNSAPDYYARTYSMGSYQAVPLLNKYYPQMSAVFASGAIGLGYNNTAQPYYLAPVFMSCNLAEGIQRLYVDNQNFTDYQDYSFYADVTPRKNIDFLSASDSNSSNIYIPSEGSHTFVIAVNNSESLSGVGWYVSRQFLDGSFGSSYPVIPTTDKNRSFTYSPYDNYGRFRVEAQIEDTYCIPHRFVTYTWYVTVGSSVSLSGYVSTGIMDNPVPNATVEISCPSGEADRLTTTDANGAYSFTGLVAGQYTLNVARTGYTCSACPDTFTLNATLEGNNPYNRDYVLTVASVTTTTLSGQTALMFLPGWSNVTDTEFKDIGVGYYFHGVMVEGATCNYSSAATVPASGLLDWDGTKYSAMVEVSGSGTSTYTVTCSKTGYDTKSAADYFYIHTGGDIYAEIRWLGYSTPLQAGTQGSYRIWYGNAQGMVEGANCVLNVNGTEYVMSQVTGDGSGEFSGHDGYSRSVAFTNAGSYSIYVSCSKTGYLDATSETHTIYVSAGTPPTTVPNHCADGAKNYDETDIDCGGTCARCTQNKKCKTSSDCASNYCSSGICRSPSCSDDIKNGDEHGIDCGGSCYPCVCFTNWDCNSDGSETCISNVCTLTTCTSDVDCPDIYWKYVSGADINYFYKARRCY